MQEEYVPPNIEAAESAPPYIPKGIKQKISLDEYHERKRKELQDKLQEDPTAGPRPRNIHRSQTEEKNYIPTTTPSEIQQQRKRGGKLVRQRRELAALYALVRDDNATLSWDQSTKIYERIDKLHLERSKNFHKRKNSNYGNYRVKGADQH